MTKTVILCDCCGREITVNERIYLKRRAGKHGGEMNCDMCNSCWERICREARIELKTKAAGDPAGI